MNFKNLKYETAEGICTITINRPDKLNALNLETIGELRSAFEQAFADEQVRSVLLTGEGPKAFVAGADISEFINFSENEGLKMAENGHRVFDMIENGPKPVLAAINGFALGGGCELAMACHMRIASENARFGQPEVNLGTIPGYGGTQRLLRLIGRTKATELILTGDRITAQEAKELGLLNAVVPAEELIPTAQKLLGKVNSKSPLVVKQLLKLVNAYYKAEEQGFAEERREFSQTFNASDFKEGMSAFLEKRKPQFQGN